MPEGESIFLSHIWVLRRQLKKVGHTPTLNERVTFNAEVYSYRRLGGRSIDRGLYNTTDYGVLPVSIDAN